ncbi:MAG TPA: hypothetical protein VMZ00_03545 [Sporichthya sp.]|nr:hypothetical protein [Sporichthya sp.]
MKRVRTTASTTLLLFAGLMGCGGGSDPAVEPTPLVSPAPASSQSAAGPLSGKDLECKNEIVRQMADPSKVTKNVPPQCKGINPDRIGDLAQIAGDELAKASAAPSGDTS